MEPLLVADRMHEYIAGENRMPNLLLIGNKVSIVRITSLQRFSGRPQIMSRL
jgi:hypothetical protein